MVPRVPGGAREYATDLRSFHGSSWPRQHARFSLPLSWRFNIVGGSRVHTSLPPGSEFIRTHTACPLLIDARASHQDIMNHRKAALATDPLSVPSPNSTVMKNGSLVQEDAAAVNRPSKWDLVRVKIIEARLSLYLGGSVAQNVYHGLRHE